MKRILLPLLIAAILLVVVPVIAQDDALPLATNTPVTIVQDNAPIVTDDVVDAPLPDASADGLTTALETLFFSLVGPFASSTAAVVLTSFIMSVFGLPEARRKSVAVGTGSVLYAAVLLVTHFGLRTQFDAVLNSLVVIIPALTTLIGTFTLQVPITAAYQSFGARMEYVSLRAQANAVGWAGGEGILRAYGVGTLAGRAPLDDLSRYVTKQEMADEMTRLGDILKAQIERIGKDLAKELHDAKAQ